MATCYQYSSSYSKTRNNGYNPSSSSNFRTSGNTNLSPMRYTNMGNSQNKYNFSNSNFNKSYGSNKVLHDELPQQLSASLALRKSPERKTLCKSMLQIEEGCVEFLKELISIECEAEKQKLNNFAKIKDFSVDDVFLFFETDNTQNDILSPQDVKDGLTGKLGLNIPDEDIKIILGKFDICNDGGISFANLFDMLVPYDKKTRDDVENRPPVSSGNLSEEIVEGLKNYIDFVINSEKHLNDVRMKILENKKFDPAQFFLENMGNEVITIQEFENFLKSKGIIQNQREADLLFIRLDRDRDGKVSVDEFAYEFNPLEG